MFTFESFFKMVKANNLPASVACDMLVPVANHLELDMVEITAYIEIHIFHTELIEITQSVLAELKKRGFYLLTSAN